MLEQRGSQSGIWTGSVIRLKTRLIGAGTAPDKISVSVRTYESYRFGLGSVCDLSRAVISYLKVSGSRLSSRPSAVSAWGYIRNGTGAPFEPGSATSWAKL